MEKLVKKRGVGLAAPQVGVSSSLFLVNLGNDPSRTPYLFINGKSANPGTIRPLAVLNPTVTGFGETYFQEEACLSIPNKLVQVKRFQGVVVTAQDRHGYPLKIKTEGFFARVIQHEFDHLQGILITDYSSET